MSSENLKNRAGSDDSLVAEIFSPTETGRLLNIEESSWEYKDYKGLGVAVIPHTPEIFAVESAYVTKVPVEDFADIFICRDPIFKSTWIVDIGVYKEPAPIMNKRELIRPYLESTDWSKPDTLGKLMSRPDVMFVMDFEKLKAQGRSNVCVVYAVKEELEKWDQKVVINEKFHDSDFKDRVTMFWILKK